MCDFPVIIWFDFCNLCDNKIKSKSVPFYFEWYVLPCRPWGEEVPWLCMGEGAAPGAKNLHTREDNIIPVVNGWIPWPVYVVVWYICDNLPYIRYYGFGNYIVGAHRLLYIVSWYYFEKLCVSSFNYSCHIIIENDFTGFN